MTENAILSLIQSHLELYPVMGLCDVYKLLHQATFGSSEAITDPDSTREWLEHEMSLPGPGDRLAEDISPDGSLWRLHLRPYVAAGGTAEPLLKLLLAGQRLPGKAEQMASRWADFAEMVAADTGLSERFPPREVALFGEVNARQNWPCSPHSPAFVAHYRPAYRVLKRDALASLLTPQQYGQIMG